MKNVLEYLEHSVQNKQEARVIDENGACSHAQLMERSRRIGSALVKRTGENMPIGVFMEKGAETLSAFFGIVYAGCFYTLLNPELPEARLCQVQSVLDAKFILTNRQLYRQAQQTFAESTILLIEELENAQIDEQALERIRENMIDTDPLYVNFTYGSTGVPKGVVIGHRSVIDFVDVFTELFEINGADVIGNQAPFDFDVSVKDIYPALKTGADLVIIPKRLFSQPVDLLDFICDHKITTMTWAVSALCLISTFHGMDYRTPETVKKVLFSGEVMPMKHLKSWMEHLPDTQFVNLYGPTEITCNCTYHRIDRCRDYAAGIPIGRAFPNERVFLLDEQDRKITQQGVCGEICVAGTAVGLGYYCAQEQTACRFVQNPVNMAYHQRIYRTGDLGCFDEAGELRFMGRKDFQIKYKGHRIELEEIEKAMMAIPGIERACCIFDQEKGRLYGFYVGAMDKKELHKAMVQTLPIFMVPGRLTEVEVMPLTKNGKIDRKALAARMGEKNR